ncbi:MAG: SBBP repeat-containing protein, partial [candidate division Zixibacteria bacterium]|nr:SBBP repeat-containing protein [candidate division Zixibacteria bacterium]
YWVSVLSGGLLFSGTALAHHREDTVWTSRFDGGGDDFPKACVLDGQDNFLVTGYSAGEGSGFDFLTVKYGPQGNIIWSRRFNGPGNGDDFAAGLVIDSAGYIYVTGQSYTGSATGFDIALLKYSPVGQLLWQRTYGAMGSGAEEARGIALDSSGNIYITGTSQNDFVTLKFLSNGDTAWVRRFGGSGVDEPVGLALDASGSIYIAGTLYLGGSAADFALVKYTVNGDSLWSQSYDGPDNLADEAVALAAGSQNQVYLSGSSAGQGSGRDFAVAAFDSSGNFLWDFRYNGPGNSADLPLSLAGDDSGYVYVSGQSMGTGSGPDFAAIRLSPNGDTSWCRRYNGPANGADAASAVVIDKSGRIYVGGPSVQDGTDYDFIALRYHPAGRKLWDEHYGGSGGGEDIIRAMAPDDSGYVFAVGESFGTDGNYDYIAVKFAPCLSMQGDLNEDGVYTPADVVQELQRVFLGVGGSTVCLADLNCDGSLTPADVVGLLRTVFEGLPTPCLK